MRRNNGQISHTDLYNGPPADYEDYWTRRNERCARLCQIVAYNCDTLPPDLSAQAHTIISDLSDLGVSLPDDLETQPADKPQLID